MPTRSPGLMSRLPAGVDPTRLRRSAARLGRPGLLAWLGVLFAGCSSDPLPEPAPRPVIVQELGRVSGEAGQRQYAGRVESVAQSDMGFMVQGRLVRVHVEAGAAVEAGQLLAELDDADYRVEQRQAAVAERTAAADLARRRTLAEEGILAPAAIELAETELANARAQREAADRQVAHTRLLAPYAGRVARRLVDPGTVVPPGEAVLSLQAGRGFDVVVDVAERDALRLPLDGTLEARATLAAAPDEPPLALVYREHSTLPAEGTRTYRLVFRGEAPDGANVLPGMALRVAMPDPHAPAMPDGLARVPLSALLTGAEGEAMVWRVDAGKAVAQPVEIVELGEAWALVRGEFADDAQVVVAGARQLGEGQAVDARLRR